MSARLKENKIQTVVNDDLLKTLMELMEEDQTSTVAEELRYLILFRRDMDKMVALVEARVNMKLPALVNKVFVERIQQNDTKEILKPLVKQMMEDVLY